MILDDNLKLSSAQAVTVTAVSTNTIDVGLGDATVTSLAVVVGVDSNATAVGAATVTFEVVSSASANLSSPTVIGSSGSIGKAELTAGRAPIIIKSSPQLIAAQKLGQRFIGVRYTVATGPLTAGSFTAYLTDSANIDAPVYPASFAVY